MEEHRDLDLTVESFTRCLSQPEFSGLRAGIALQAYLPDTHQALGRLLDFAQERVKGGGTPLRVRLVKGANLAMEKTAAELACWPQPPYKTKAETDASYKALLVRLLEAAKAGAVEVGVASHNLFDVAFALVLCEVLGVTVDVEMLAGMADDQAAAVAERTSRASCTPPLWPAGTFATLWPTWPGGWTRTPPRTGTSATPSSLSPGARPGKPKRLGSLRPSGLVTMSALRGPSVKTGGRSP